MSPEQEALTARIEMAVRDVLEPHLQDASFDEQCRSFAWLMSDEFKPGSFMYVIDVLDISMPAVERIRARVQESAFAKLPRVRRA
jgi:hypothetical protein